VRRAGYDSVTRRARTGRAQKIGWLTLSMVRAGVTLAMPQSAVLHAAPASEVAFLVNAAARHAVRRPRSDGLFNVLAQLEARDRAIPGE
jgi:15-cis-phytoene synthase